MSLIPANAQEHSGVMASLPEKKEQRLDQHQHVFWRSKRKPKIVNLVADKGFSYPFLAQKLWESHRMRLITPRRINQFDTGRPPISRMAPLLAPEIGWMDPRHLRRLKRRWIVERFFGWLRNYRRLLCRWEVKPENFMGFIHLACCLLVIRHF